MDSTVGEGVEAELVELTLFLLLELVMPWPLPRSRSRSALEPASRSVATLAARVRDRVVGRCTVDGQRPSPAAGSAGSAGAPLGVARGSTATADLAGNTTLSSYCTRKKAKQK